MKKNKVLPALHPTSFSSTDGSGNNSYYMLAEVIITCKRYYEEVICKELIPKQGKPQECSLSSSNIVEKYLDYMRAQRIQIPPNKYTSPSYFIIMVIGS